MNRRIFADDPNDELRQAEQQLDYIARYVIELRNGLRPRRSDPDAGSGRSAYCLGAAIGTASVATHLLCQGSYGRGNYCGCSCHSMSNAQRREKYDLALYRRRAG